VGGVDIIVENVCGEFLNKSLSMANYGGRICIVGALGGVRSQIDVVTIIFQRLQIHGIQLNTYTDAEVHQAWQDIMRLLRPRQGKIPVDRVFPFEQVQEAFEHMRGGTMGKVVIGPMSP